VRLDTCVLHTRHCREKARKEALTLSIRGVPDVEQRAILIVDDDEIILETISEFLQSKGYAVATAGTAKEAMEKSRSRNFNLALLDIKLPDMEGTELLRKLHSVMPKMMKVMITAHGTLRNAVDSLNYGADGYLLKPINQGELLKTVESKLREQYATETMSEEQVAEWISTRLRKLEQNQQS
jgi:DNA-binding response OmpR family regulator